MKEYRKDGGTPNTNMTIVSLRVEGVGGEGGKQQFVIANTPEISGISKYTLPLLQQLRSRCG